MIEVADLRTDAVTRPTEAMWEAMRSAPLGWALPGEDLSVLRLQEVAAHMTGKERALFVPTGTMANLVALMAYAPGGEQIVAEASSHILWSEEWSYASLCGLAARPVEGKRGALPPEEVSRALVDRRFGHHPTTAVVCLENTHNAAGGAVIGRDATEAVARIAHEHGVPVHLDGARLANAAVAAGMPMSELAAPADSVMLGLTKGLSAPLGAVLCGSADFITRARKNLQRLGGHTVPQVGILAAAGLVALQTMAERLEEDHRRARKLARGLAEIADVSVDEGNVETNIVMARFRAEGMTAHRMAMALEARGVRAYVYSFDTLRFVTHRHITDNDIESAVMAVADIVRRETCSTS